MIGKRQIKLKLRKFFPYTVGFLLVVLAMGIFIVWPKADRFAGASKSITLSDNELLFSFAGVTESTVGEFLEKNGLALGEKETVFPEYAARLTTGMTLFVTRTHVISVQADGAQKSYAVLATSVGEALVEVGVTLDEDDIVQPARAAVAARGTTIVVTRVDIREEVIEKSVAFEKKANEDDKLSWRKTVVTQKGEKGTDRLVYRVSSHDGKEVNRKLVRTERIKEPVTEIVTQGTYVKLGKSHTGGASWYAWTGTMAAANPWLPKGSYVKVTNVDNGKSVIVVINDRGPFVPGRIIDLDKVAFAKIASVGAGVINVKMEEVTN